MRNAAKISLPTLGLYHHALMTMLAFAFLQHLRLGKTTTSPGPPSTPSLPQVCRQLGATLSAFACLCSHCRKLYSTTSGYQGGRVVLDISARTALRLRIERKVGRCCPPPLPCARPSPFPPLPSPCSTPGCSAAGKRFYDTAKGRVWGHAGVVRVRAR